MTEKKGWIKIYRSIADDPVLQDPDCYIVFSHLLMSAAWKPEIRRVKLSRYPINVPLQPGQTVLGKRYFASIGIGTRRYQKAIRRLKESNLICVQPVADACGKFSPRSCTTTVDEKHTPTRESLSESQKASPIELQRNCDKNPDFRGCASPIELKTSKDAKVEKAKTAENRQKRKEKNLTKRKASLIKVVTTICNYDKFQSVLSKSESNKTSTYKGIPRVNQGKNQESRTLSLRTSSRLYSRNKKNLHESSDFREELQSDGECFSSFSIFDKENQQRRKRFRQFDDWWARWTIPGTKRGKRIARKKLLDVLASGDVTFDQICDAVDRYMDFCRDWNLPANKIKHPANWLDGGHWDDELPENPLSVSAIVAKMETTDADWEKSDEE